MLSAFFYLYCSTVHSRKHLTCTTNEYLQLSSCFCSRTYNGILKSTTLTPHLFIMSKSIDVSNLIWLWSEMETLQLYNTSHLMRRTMLASEGSGSHWFLHRSLCYSRRNRSHHITSRLVRNHGMLSETIVWFHLTQRQFSIG